MDLQKVTNKNLICLNSNLKSKDDVIKYLIDKLYKEGKISSKENFYKDVLKRESISETGIDSGIAIPHGKSKFVNEASFAVLTVPNPIEEWESIIPDNKVTMIFLLAIPEAEAGSTHLEILGKLMTKVSDEAFLNKLRSAKTADEFYKFLGNDDESKLSEPKNTGTSKMIVAVTACPAGIAHTYMAAEALVKAGNELGVKVFVEKQGANGVEDRHTNEQLKNADAAIFATEVAVKEQERYSHLPIHKVKVADPIRDGKSVIKAALEKAEKQGKGSYIDKGSSEEKSSVKNDIKKAVLTGISYIIPIIVAGGMMNAFAVMIAQGFGLQELYNLDNSWLWLFRKLGGNLLGTIMIPMLSAYMAYSLGDKPALAPGFAAGVASNLINGGFLCGMLGGIFAGYTIRFLRKYLPPKGTLKGFISFWVYPVLSTLLVGIMMFFIIGKPIAYVNQALIEALGRLSGSNAALLGAILGIMVSFDLGGPVNKAAYTFCVAAMAEGIIMPYAVFASVKMVSAFAVTFATQFFKPLYTDDEKEIGMSTWILGLAGITEGAIPFMMAHPVSVISSLCIGSAITGILVAVSGLGLDVPGAGIFSMFLLKNGVGGIMNSLIWFFAAVLGAIVSTVLLIITRKNINKKMEAKNA